MLKFDYSKVVFATELGVGTYGTIYPYQKDPNDKRFVVKHMHAKDTNTLLSMIQEIVIGFSCNHPYIMPVTGYYIEPLKPKGFNVFIKMPRMKENLYDFIKTQRKNNVSKIPEEKVVKYLHAMLSAMEYLVDKKIAHRDIKPTNVLLDEEGNIKLSDIGSATFIDDEEGINLISQQVGTFFYMAPEVLANFRDIKRKDLYVSDIWSMGLVIAELCLLQTQLMNPHQYPKEPIIKDILKKIQANYGQNLVKVLTEMLYVNPNQRNKTAKDLKVMLEESYASIFSKEKPADPLPIQKVEKPSEKPVKKAKEEKVKEEKGQDMGASTKSIESTETSSSIYSSRFFQSVEENDNEEKKTEDKKPTKK